jgi:membrane-bound metal-dependent hydrolase YbcI (DUF457 family)
VPEGTLRRSLVVLAGLGMLPDIDLLFGVHSMYTHSIGAVAVVGLVAAGVARDYRARLGAACALAYGSHVLFDWLGSDTSVPIGIMALWPFTSSFYESDLHIFHAISRRFATDGWILHNVRAVIRELLILGPVAAGVWIIRGRRTPTA